MFRSILAVLVAMVLTVGSVFADEIKAVFVKYDGGKVTVKVEDKEKTFAVDEKATVKTKAGDKALTEVLAKVKADTKITLTVNKDVVTGFKAEKKAK